MRVRRMALADSGASVRKEGFKAVNFIPDQPDEMGLWPKGVVPAIASGGGVWLGWG